MKYLLGDQIRAEGQDGRQGSLDQVIVDAVDQLRDHVPQSQANYHAASGDADEVDQAGDKVEIGLVQGEAGNQAKDHDRRPVVEQAFPLQEYLQALQATRVSTKSVDPP